MLIPSNFSKCILCLKDPPGDPEHVIPECVGGRLRIRTLCDKCNNSTGTRLVATIKKDPRIRSCVTQLKERLPALYRDFFGCGEPYIGAADDGTGIPLVRKGDTFRVVSEKRPDGKTVLSRVDVERAVRRSLEKQGAATEEIGEQVAGLRSVECGASIEVAGWAFEKHLPKAVAPNPVRNAQVADERLGALIAFNWLACLMGENVYEPHIDPLRGYINSGSGSAAVNVSRHPTGSRAPMASHSLCALNEKSQIGVYVVFFDWLVFEVRLGNMPQAVPECVYRVDLESRRELVAESRAAAKRGDFRILSGPS